MNDYSQVSEVVLGDYETGGREIKLALVGNIVHIDPPDDAESIGVNIKTLKRALKYLQQDNEQLHESLTDYKVLPEDYIESPISWRTSAPTVKGTTRPSWEEYAITLAQAAATRSEDPYVQVGAVVLRKDHSVAALGYNGAPSGIELDWTDRDERRKRVLHAEANALRYVEPGEGDLLAATMHPCLECLKAARAQGITRVVYRDSVTPAYDSKDIAKIAKEFGVTITQIAK